jgi:hypothetical protein
MKTTAELEQDILTITMSIDKDFPELSKYIKEMPAKVSMKDEEEINIKNLKEYYNSLKEMKSEYAKTHAGAKDKNDKEKITFSGYPLYPASEDIYSQGKKEMKLNPTDLLKNKVPNEEAGERNEKDFDADMSGDDLDVPGSELDDQQESVGSEDEENNYYSLGGDNHNDLEEDKG